MDWRQRVREELKNATGDPAADEDVVDEIAQHLTQRYDDLIARGIAADEATQRTIAELRRGHPLSQSIRHARRFPAAHPTPPPSSASSTMFTDLSQDLRYALRLLARNPAFTTAAVLTLALGIGATTAIFSVVDSVLLRPVPFAEQDRLAMVWETDRNSGTTREPASVPDYLDFQQRSKQFAAFAAFRASELNLTPTEGEPARVAALGVTHGFLPLLGIRPIHGRVFTAQEDVPRGPPVVLISERLWEDQFQRDRDVLNKTIRLNDQEFTIVGVMPRDADFGTMQILTHAAYGRGFADRDARSRVDVWGPMQADPQRLPRSTHPILVVGKLAPGATSARAQQELAAIMSDLEAAYPENAARGAFIEPMSEVIFGRVKPALWLLLAAVGLVLLIACVNVANLLLARGAERSREVAVRTAMGAVTGRLTRQFVVENLVLAAIASALGIGLAYAGLTVLLALAPADIPRLDAVSIDLRVLGASLALAVAAGLVFGIVPIAQARRLDLQLALRSEESRSASAGRARGLFRSSLVVAEVGLAVMLVVGAGLLIRSFWHLSKVDPGFDAEGVIKAEFQLPASRYQQNFATYPNFPEIERFNGDLLRRVSSLPGVESAALTANHPLDAGFTNSFQIVGREEESRSWPEISVRRVSPEYFSTLRMSLPSGRGFQSGDNAQAPPVAVINAEAARRFFVGREPIGQQIRFWGAARAIVGVTANEKIHGLTKETPPAVYIPLAQAPTGTEALLVRARGSALSLAGPIRSTIRTIDPALAVFGMEPLSETLATSIAQRRFLMLLLALFAGLALTLAAIGIHGVLSYTVEQRRHEIGIRMALGAPPERVTRLVVRRGAMLTGIGLVLGLGAALLLTRSLSGLLFGVSATDLMTMAATLPVLAMVALVATYLPARRAVRIDPLAAMREE
jgi:predicted permease